MPLTPPDLADIAERTLESYRKRADAFWLATRHHDVRQNLDALLDQIVGKPPFSILDLGCGPGRDLKTLRDLGHHAVGVEGCESFASMARSYSGCQVWQQDLLRLQLPVARFDGIFANAVLFHVPTQELPRVLSDLRNALKAGGILFSSNPRGEDEEGWNQGRYGAYHRLETWRRHMAQADFVELAHYYRPAGLPRDQQPWLATVWRKPSTEDRTSHPSQ